MNQAYHVRKKGLTGFPDWQRYAGFVESAVNQVVAKRMVKKEQMRWTERGAHLLLQIRARLLNEEWGTTLSRWYPAMKVKAGAVAA